MLTVARACAGMGSPALDLGVRTKFHSVRCMTNAGDVLVSNLSTPPYVGRHSERFKVAQLLHSLAVKNVGVRSGESLRGRRGDDLLSRTDKVTYTTNTIEVIGMVVSILK